jgi:Zn/Cd-binding protein ZinT
LAFRTHKVLKEHLLYSLPKIKTLEKKSLAKGVNYLFEKKNNKKNKGTISI